MFKNILTIFLSLLLIEEVAQFNVYRTGMIVWQGMCDSNCEDSSHRTSSTKCDNCLVEDTQRLIVHQGFQISTRPSSKLTLITKASIVPAVKPLVLYGRPPPSSSRKI